MIITKMTMKEIDMVVLVFVKLIYLLSHKNRHSGLLPNRCKSNQFMCIEEGAFQILFNNNNQKIFLADGADFIRNIYL